MVPRKPFWGRAAELETTTRLGGMVSDDVKLRELKKGEGVVDGEVTEADEIFGRAPPGVTAFLVCGATRISLRRDGACDSDSFPASRNWLASAFDYLSSS